MAEGKKPFFLKKSDERVLNLARRYQELESKNSRKIDDVCNMLAPLISLL